MLRLIEKSSTLPVTLEEMTLHLRRSDSHEDDEYIEGCLRAAIDWAEKFTGLALVSQTWDLFADNFPTDGGPIYLRRAPVIDVVGVFYRDTTETEFSSGSYLLNEATGAVYLPANGLWPTTDGALNAVRIRFRAGYIDLQDSPASDASIPASIAAAIKLYAATLYGNREQFIVGTTVTPAPWGAEQLLRMYKVDDSLA